MRQEINSSKERESEGVYFKKVANGCVEILGKRTIISR